MLSLFEDVAIYLTLILILQELAVGMFLPFLAVICILAKLKAFIAKTISLVKKFRQFMRVPLTEAASYYLDFYVRNHPDYPLLKRLYGDDFSAHSMHYAIIALMQHGLVIHGYEVNFIRCSKINSSDSLVWVEDTNDLRKRDWHKDSKRGKVLTEYTDCYVNRLDLILFIIRLKLRDWTKNVLKILTLQRRFVQCAYGR